MITWQCEWTIPNTRWNPERIHDYVTESDCPMTFSCKLATVSPCRTRCSRNWKCQCAVGTVVRVVVVSSSSSLMMLWWWFCGGSFRWWTWNANTGTIVHDVTKSMIRRCSSFARFTFFRMAPQPPPSTRQQQGVRVGIHSVGLCVCQIDSDF